MRMRRQVEVELKGSGAKPPLRVVCVDSGHDLTDRAIRLEIRPPRIDEPDGIVAEVTLFTTTPPTMSRDRSGPETEIADVVKIAGAW